MPQPYVDCAEKDETITHVVAEGKMLAQKQCRLCRYDKVGVIVLWVMCKRYGFSNAGNGMNTQQKKC